MKINGIAASAGIRIGKVFKYTRQNIVITDNTIDNIEHAIICFEEALKTSHAQLLQIKEDTIIKMDEAHGDIFEAHIQMLKDPVIQESVKEIIKNEYINPAMAYSTVCNQYIKMFESMDDEYMKERAADIKDVSTRVLSNILGYETIDLSSINEKVILIAEDLTPSDTAQLNKEYVQGFITDIGGRTSHSAIMARTLEIPAIVGSKVITKEVTHGDMIILDGIEGLVITNPSESEITLYQNKCKTYEDNKEVLLKLKNTNTVTKDGHKLDLAANIGSPNDIEGVIKNGAEGIGLYRTEFLYMDSSSLPSEELQYEAYKKVLESVKANVVIRTLDIGGDKTLSYMDMPKEMNPFLGHRAVRLCFEHLDMFKTQLRALLRASVHGKLSIMFPMIATLDEFRKAKSVLEEVKDDLKDVGIAVDENIEVGIMVEIPAAALLSDKFAKEVDFFSIGTNDLIQYTFAADRMNEKVSYLYQPYNPSLLRLIKMVIDNAHKEGKWVGMCGEMAGDLLAVPLLVGMGIDELSMSAPSILPARDLLRRLEMSTLKVLSEEVLECDSNESVLKLLEDRLN